MNTTKHTRPPHWAKPFIAALLAVLLLSAGGACWHARQQAAQRHELHRGMVRTYAQYTDNIVLTDKFQDLSLTNTTPDQWPDDPILPQASTGMKAAIDDYNQLHPDQQTTYQDVANSLGKHLKTITQTNQNTNTLPPFHFLDWCKQDADLQYVNDSGTHKAGDTFRGLSNYTYSTYKDSDYRDLERVPGTGTH